MCVCRNLSGWIARVLRDLSECLRMAHLPGKRTAPAPCLSVAHLSANALVLCLFFSFLCEIINAHHMLNIYTAKIPQTWFRLMPPRTSPYPAQELLTYCFYFVRAALGHCLVVLHWDIALSCSQLRAHDFQRFKLNFLHDVHNYRPK